MLCDLINHTQELEGKLSKLKQDSELLLSNSNQAFHLMANKPGKHLAALIKQIQAKPTLILKDKDSNPLIRNDKPINKTFKSFY